MAQFSFISTERAPEVAIQPSPMGRWSGEHRPIGRTGTSLCCNLLGVDGRRRV
jgi:hypothetical protein